MLNTFTKRFVQHNEPPWYGVRGTEPEFGNMIQWCIENFGKSLHIPPGARTPPSNLSWSFDYIKSEIWFRQQEMYSLFLLRWGT